MANICGRSLSAEIGQVPLGKESEVANNQLQEGSKSS